MPDSQDDLRIPTDARDGNADFLNGNWRAGAGIQDRDTGEPLRLHYQFKNGEGRSRSIAITACNVRRRSALQWTKGALSISNSVAARCTDGGTYDMPLIQCKPGMTNIASCAGNYGNELSHIHAPRPTLIVEYLPCCPLLIPTMLTRITSSFSAIQASSSWIWRARCQTSSASRGEFCMHPSGRMPIRLYVPADGKPGYEDKPGSFFETKAAFSLPMQESLELFDGFWLPVPFFRYKSDSQFDQGPKNWARLRFVKLAQADANGNTHRLTLAFDTRTRARDDARDYIEPYDEDMETGALFRLAFNLHEMEWFLDEQEWVVKWLESIFRERRDDLENREIEKALAKKEHLAHYLNLLSLMREAAPTTRSNKELKERSRSSCRASRC